jgi:hypothetical protein
MERNRKEQGKDTIQDPAAPVCARLRDLDWRFLLPTPPESGFRHLLLLGGSASMRELICATGLAQRVSLTVPREQSVDAVVILRRAEVSPAAVAHALAPGAVLYWELDRRQRARLTYTPVHIRRHLYNAGFKPTGFYWVRPNFANPQLYIPLDTQALCWYLDRLFVAKTLALRIIEPGLRLLARLGSRSLAFLAGCAAVTAVVGPTHPAAPSVLASPALPAVLRTPTLRPLMLTAGGDDFNRVILLPFAPDSTEPVAVVKLSRHPSRNQHTENEQVVLAALQKEVAQPIQQALPQALGSFQWREIRVGVESCVPGQLLLAATGRWGVSLKQKIEQIQDAATWLTEFHGQVQRGRMVWDKAAIQQWVEQHLVAYQQAFGLTPGEEQLFAAVRKHARSLIGRTLPIVWEHYAFSDWNIYRDGQRTYVVDWEGASEGLPLFDLLYLVIHSAYVARNLSDDAAQLRCFRAIFCTGAQTDPLAPIAQEWVTHYMRRIEIDPRFYPMLLVLLWVIRALSRFDRQVGLQQNEGDRRSDNQYVRYLAVLADHVEQLFS